MCGIAGIVAVDPSECVDSAVLRLMTDSLSRRGPDDCGQVIDGNAGLGMRRLSVIDVAGGHQPMSNEDGTLWIVYNGEVVNHEPLRADLIRRGHCFRTRSDTETILHLFEEEGPDCLKHLRGMFAFAIWDTRQRSLFVARDRFGIKPLHYYFDGRVFLFGSEIKSLLHHPAVSRRMDWTAIDAFFTYGYIPAPWTVYRDVRKLLPGHYMIADARGVRDVEYWDLAMEPKHRGSDRDLEVEFMDRFKESVAMHMLSDVPIGAFLSGGVDSSLLVAMMAKSSPTPINTFTIGFDGERGNFLDERVYAREVSDRYRTNHYEYEVTPHPEEAIDVALEAFDEPFADDSLIPTHHICGLARRHATVALTGLGGDEAFAGYARYLGFRFSDATERLPWKWLLNGARPFVNLMRETKDGHNRVNHVKRFVAGANAPPAVRWQRYNALFSAEARRALYQPAIASEIDFEEVDRAGRRYFENCDASDALDRALYQDIKMYLADDILALTDRVGMWHSLELRVPYLDHTLLEFCARLPTRLKIRFAEKKHLLRRAAAAHVPESVLNHRKQGFASPMAMWLRGGLRGYVSEHLSKESIEEGGVLNAANVRTLIDAHEDRRSFNERQIFAVLMFQRWFASCQPARVAALCVAAMITA